MLQPARDNAPDPAEHLERLLQQPESFADRGVTAAFANPSLALVRFRKGPDGRPEFLLPGFAGGHGVYVTRAGNLGALVGMSMYDRSLAEALTDDEAVTPGAVRETWMDVALSGVGGAGPAREAKAWLEDRESAGEISQILFLIELIGADGDAARLLSDLGDAGHRQTLRHAVARVAQLSGLSAELVFRRISDLTVAIQDLGLRPAKRAGRLRRRLTELDELAHAMREWAYNTAADAAPLAVFVGRCAEYSHHLSVNALASIDMRLGEPLRLLVDWDREFPALGRDIGRLEWLLDGWQIPLGVRDAAVVGNRLPEQAVRQMAAATPIVPPGERGRTDPRRIDGVGRKMSSRVRENEDWQTGELDRRYAAMADAGGNRE